MIREFQFILAGMTPRDMNGRKSPGPDTGRDRRWKVDAMSDPAIAGWRWLFNPAGHKNLNLVFAGGYEGCFGTFGPPDVDHPS